MLFCRDIAHVYMCAVSEARGTAAVWASCTRWAC